MPQIRVGAPCLERRCELPRKEYEASDAINQWRGLLGLLESRLAPPLGGILAAKARLKALSHRSHRANPWAAKNREQRKSRPRGRLLWALAYREGVCSFRVLFILDR